MAPRPKGMLFSRTFPGQIYDFRRQSIPDLKVTNKDVSKKYIIFIQRMADYCHFWYSLLLTPSSCLVHPVLFKFKLEFQDYIQVLVFFYYQSFLLLT